MEQNIICLTLYETVTVCMYVRVHTAANWKLAHHNAWLQTLTAPNFSQKKNNKVKVERILFNLLVGYQKHLSMSKNLQPFGKTYAEKNSANNSRRFFKLIYSGLALWKKGLSMRIRIIAKYLCP